MSVVGLASLCRCGAGGEDHQTGTEPSYNPYEKLVDYTKAHWPDVEDALLMWNGQVGVLGGWLGTHTTVDCQGTPVVFWANYGCVGIAD